MCSYRMTNLLLGNWRYASLWLRLQSMGSLRVGHDWATSLSLFTFMHWRRQWQPTPVFLPGESQGRGSWWAAVYGVTQSRTRLKRLSSSSSSSSLWLLFETEGKFLLDQIQWNIFYCLGISWPFHDFPFLTFHSWPFHFLTFHVWLTSLSDLNGVLCQDKLALEIWHLIELIEISFSGNSEMKTIVGSLRFEEVKYRKHRILYDLLRVYSLLFMNGCLTFLD